MTTTRKLGRRPAKNAPALRLYRSLTAVPVHPVSADHFAEVTDWGLYGNDEFGDCGPVSVANYVKLITRYLTGAEVSVSQADVFDLYRRSGNPGFDPTTDADDNGVDMQTMLEALTAGGIGGRKPVAFAKVDHTSTAEIQAAIAIFGGVLFGVDLAVAQQTQTDAGGPWQYVAGSGEWGGHAIVAGRYSGAATGSDVAVVSWAEVLGTTDAFLAHQLQEAWVVIFPEHLGSTAFMEGINVATLAADYQALTGRTFPVPVTPTPVPDPTPVPVGPVPSVDPASVQLAAAFRFDGWIDKHHVGDNAHVQRAARVWLEAEGI